MGCSTTAHGPGEQFGARANQTSCRLSAQRTGLLRQLHRHQTLEGGQATETRGQHALKLSLQHAALHQVDAAVAAASAAPAGAKPADIRGSAEACISAEHQKKEEKVLETFQISGS